MRVYPGSPTPDIVVSTNIGFPVSGEGVDSVMLRPSRNPRSIALKEINLSESRYRADPGKSKIGKYENERRTYLSEGPSPGFGVTFLNNQRIVEKSSKPKRAVAIVKDNIAASNRLGACMDSPYVKSSP